MKKINSKSLIFFLLLILLPSLYGQSERHYRLTRIKILNNTYTRQEVIVKFCNLEEGKLYSLNQLRKEVKDVREALINTLYFDRVNVFLRDGKTGDSKIFIIEVFENQFPYILGGGAIYAHFTHLNKNGRGIDNTLQLGLNRVSLYSRHRWIANSRFNATYGISWEREHELEMNTAQYRPYKMDAEIWNIGANLSYNITARRQIAIGLRFFRYVPYRLPSIYTSDPEFRAGKYLGVKISFYDEHRDHIFYPKKGYYLFTSLGTYYEVSSGGTYSKYFTDFRLYPHLSDKFHLLLRFYGGAVTKTAPYPELFLMDNIRALRIKNSSHLHGYQTVLFTFEFRKDLVTLPFLFNAWVELAGFIDTGKVWWLNESLRFGDLDSGYGPILRFHIPYPIYVDLDFEYSFNRNGNAFFFGVKHNL